jgi:hypothetical protein
MKPLINEGDYIYFLERDKRENKVFVVEKVEDLVYDYPWASAVTTGAISNFTEISNLEPKQVTGDGAEIQVYQIRAGVDVGMVYTEMLAGTIRRTVYKQRRPTTALPYVGYFDENSSPYSSPRLEFFLRYNEKPAFAVYNPFGFSITPTMSFRGRKLRLFDMDKPAAVEQYTGMSAAEISRVKTQVVENRIPHRRITVFGMED